MDARAVRQAFAGAANPAAFTPELLDHYAKAAQVPGAMTAMINYYRANASNFARWGSDKTDPIAAPTLVIWGEKDPFLAVDLAQASAALASDAILERLPHAGHWAPQEDAPTVNACITAWLEAKGLAKPA
jgi:pimeloyl-ACP methyl ester carboxylesterase